MVVTLPSFVYKNVDVAKQGLENLGVTVEVVGNGNKVLSQFPEGGSQMSKNYGKVLLYTYEEGSIEIPDYDYGEVEVPNVLNNTVTNAVANLLAAGFNVNIQGNINSQAGSVPVVDYQTGLGQKLPKGTVILIKCNHPNVDDQGHIDSHDG